MDKRVHFRSPWLPYALVLPQIAVTLVFFFWPAAETLYYSVLMQDAFASKIQFVWFDNFMTLFQDSHYLASFKITVMFSAIVAVTGLALSLLLAVFADRVLRGASVYKTLLIWPYAVAPAVAGILWLFMLSPSIGMLTYVLRGPVAKDLTAVAIGRTWKTTLNATDSAALSAGSYVWSAVVTNIAERITVGVGSLAITTDLASVTAPFDSRTTAQIALANCEVAMATFNATGGKVKKYEIAGRTMEFQSIAELMTLHSFWQMKVLGEGTAASVAAGMGNPRNLYTRFVSP